MRQHERSSLWNVTMSLILTGRGHAHESYYPHIILSSIIDSNSEMQHWSSMEPLDLWHYAYVSKCLDCTCDRIIKDKWDYDSDHDCMWWYNYWQTFETFWILIFVQVERCFAFPNSFCWWPMWCLTSRNNDVQWHCSDRNMQGPCTWLNCHWAFL